MLLEKGISDDSGYVKLSSLPRSMLCELAEMRHDLATWMTTGAIAGASHFHLYQ